MSRLSPIALGALACVALAAAPAAVAAPTTETCAAASPQVVGGKVTAKLTASNVDPLQAQFATCAHAKRVIKKVTQLGLEQPRGDVAGLYCRPEVFFTEPDFVLYVCTFRGADTATFIKSTFAVQYKS